MEIGICGDGVVQVLLGEQCEQAVHDSTLPYDCVDCLLSSRSCGDGKIDPGESCDDGARNSTSPDANCRPNCQQYSCGDGIVDSAEVCDDGNRLSGDGCDRYCKEESVEQPTPTQIAFEQNTPTQVAAEFTNPSQPAALQQFQQFPGSPYSQSPQVAGSQQFGFPQYPSYQQLPFQLPLAQLQPLVTRRGPVGETGPAAVAVIGAGAAGGLSWIRRRRK